METFGREKRRGIGVRSLWLVVIAMLLSAATRAQAPATPVSPVDPLPQDTGAAGLKQMLVRLKTTARLMQTTAHPDDEDGGMLTLESRGRGATTLLFTLTRGEGGQNKLGSNLFDVLGVVRTLELTAADRYYGVEQRFSRVADFGYSKNPEETFQKWQGHDIALGDMVRVIRTFRPDVLVARFSGTERDGHGHHQASSILTKEAFRAAADPNKFPEQIKQGLLPWQAKKLYIGNVCGFGATSCPPENYTVKLNTGEFSPALGMSYVQFAINEGLRHQLSQGAGGWTVDPGDRFAFYKLADSVVESKKDKDGHEQDLFDGIDTSLTGLASRLVAEEGKVPWLKPALEKIATEVQKATEASTKNSIDAAGPLLSLANSFPELLQRVEESSLSEPAKADLLIRLREKQQQAETAATLAMNVSVEALVNPFGQPRGQSTEQTPAAVSPGQRFTVSVRFHNGSKYPLSVRGTELETPKPGWVIRQTEDHDDAVNPGADHYANFFVQVPADAAYTRPYWHRDEPERESVNMVDDQSLATRAFPPLQLHARVVYQPAGKSDSGTFSLLGWRHGLGKGSEKPEAEVSAPVIVQSSDPNRKQDRRSLAIVPLYSIALDPGEHVITLEDGAASVVKVAVTGNVESRPLPNPQRTGHLSDGESAPSTGVLRLQVPSGWRVEPTQLPVELHHRGEKQEYEFKVFPANLKEGRTEVRAVLEAGGRKYSEGYSVVTREDLDTFYYYQPAVQRVSVVDVKAPKELKVGYIMGAGDDIPTVLKQIGMDVSMIPAESLASADLSGFQTVALGIRAYDTQKSVVANNKKLLDFVSAGGTLVVQYNASASDFNSGHFTPFPASLSRARVSVEDAAVEMLAPDDSVFQYPNKITARDFDGWVQERGLYFMDSWDGKFEPLLASHDPGEQPQKGGLLKAQYGKGIYIYTGYSFFRQLPAGVPGAIRLYVNLLSQSSAMSRQASTR